MRGRSISIVPMEREPASEAKRGARNSQTERDPAWQFQAKAGCRAEGAADPETPGECLGLLGRLRIHRCR